MDQLTIHGLHLLAKIGVYPWEQHPQVLKVDLTFPIDTQQVARTDHLGDTIDYDALSQHIMQFAQNTHYRLLESFGEHLAQSLLSHFALTWVKLTLHKPAALKAAQNVSLTLERS